MQLAPRCPDIVAEAAAGGEGELQLAVVAENAAVAVVVALLELVVVDDIVVEVRGKSSDSFSSTSMKVVETQKLLVC